MIRSSNIYLQDQEDFIEERSPNNSLISNSSHKNSFAHLTNFYLKKDRDKIDLEQKHVIDSLSVAASGYSAVGGKIKLLAICEEKHIQHIPSKFISVSGIKRRANDIYAFNDLPPLPFLFDILASANDASITDSDYLIYSNFDIVLQPYFYDCINYYLTIGYDSIIVNRRTISEQCIEAPLHVGQSQIGIPHPGMDCFVFPKSWLASFIQTDAITGVGFVMRSLFYNLVSKAESLLFLRHAHLTFHYGDDRPWMAPYYQMAELHNVNEAKRVWDYFMQTEFAPRFVDLETRIPSFSPTTMLTFRSQ